MTCAFERGGDPGEFIAVEGAAGPWSSDTCHGGAPAALLVQVAEDLPAPAPMSVARVTMGLLRRVPLGRLRVESRIVREGKKVQLIALGLSANGVDVARATVLRMRSNPETVPDRLPLLAVALPGPEHGRPTRGPQSGGFSALFTMRAVKGGFEGSGRGRCGSG